jgi:hypothetical protein
VTVHVHQPGTWRYRLMLARQLARDAAWWLAQFARLALLASLLAAGVVLTGWLLAIGGRLG